MYVYNKYPYNIYTHLYPIHKSSYLTINLIYNMKTNEYQTRKSMTLCERNNWTETIRPSSRWKWAITARDVGRRWFISSFIFLLQFLLFSIVYTMRNLIYQIFPFVPTGNGKNDATRRYIYKCKLLWLNPMISVSVYRVWLDVSRCGFKLSVHVLCK